jgi:hypothetical protein
MPQYRFEPAITTLDGLESKRNERESVTASGRTHDVTTSVHG